MRKEMAKRLLGMAPATARQKLFKNLLFRLTKEFGICTCWKCNQQIPHANDLAIEHIRAWETNPDLYWDLENIRFGCVRCMGPKESNENEMQTLQSVDKQLNITSYGGIVVKLNRTKTNGKYPSFSQDGQIYFMSKPHERYTVDITNPLSRTVEVVVTVDGLDVITGDPGNYSKHGGYMVESGQTIRVAGWRSSLGEVGAFEFSKRLKMEDTYVAQNDRDRKNIGVIGVAVFFESTSLLSLLRKVVQSGGATSTSAVGSRRSGLTTEGALVPMGLAPSVNPQTYAMNYSCAVPNIQTLQQPMYGGYEMGNGSPDQTPVIGTEAGDIIPSQCWPVSFERENPEKPDFLHLFEYDTEKNFRKRGLLPETQTKDGKQAFQFKFAPVREEDDED